jgi:putative spermidine/putrescine transport system permease protein
LTLGGHAALVAAFLIVPTLLVAAMSFTSSSLLSFPPKGFSLEWYSNFFHDQEWRDSAATSIKVALATAVLATALGTAMAMGLVRGEYRGKSLIVGLVLGPLLAPLIVAAVGLNLMFSKWHLTGSLPGLIAAHTCLALPYVVINVMAGLRVVDPRLEMAARTLGASPLRAFVKITLPLIAPSMAAAMLFAFIASWDEVVVSIFLSSSEVRTLPVVMWSQLHSSIDPTVAAVATMLSVITVLTLGVVALVRRRATVVPG